jgi:hypothetical protein
MALLAADFIDGQNKTTWSRQANLEKRFPFCSVLPMDS